MRMMIAFLLLIPQDSETTTQDEARAALRKALKSSLALGGMEIKGEVKEDKKKTSGGVILVQAGGAPYVGDFTGRIDARGITHIEAKKKGNIIEVFAVGDRWVIRQTWTGAAAAPVGSFAAEAVTLTDWVHLLDNLGRFENFKLGDEEKVDGIACRTYTARIPTDVLKKDPGEKKSERGVRVLGGAASLSRIRSKFWVSKDDGRIVKMGAKLSFRISGFILQEGGAPIEGSTTERTFEFRTVRYEKKMKVELPEAVKRLLSD